MKTLTLFVLLLLSITLLGASDSKKESINKKLDNFSEESFDAESDEETLQKLKKKSDEKENDSSTSVSEKDDEKKKDSVGFDTTKETKKNSKNINDSQNTQDSEKIEEKNNFTKMINLGGGYNGSFDYKASEHLALEFIFYGQTKLSFISTGVSLGVGGINFNEVEPYLSLAATGKINLINPKWGPFIRADLGLMAWWVPSKDDNSDNEDEDNEDNIDIKMIGIIAKLGTGIIVGGERGVNFQLLYDVHATTSGLDNGLEIQIGFTF